ncbi:UNVERIFIED_CONTAM: hypothetical protein GTU68_019586 [Idotea baltica]|nr:hypothetical protein [Idotea baltica]
MQTVLYSGVPNASALANVEAGVVALKSRSNAPEDAIKQSLQALRWLQAQGCRQFFFKYCSTFDSTSQGNIGPVAEALAAALNASKVIVCPAFPGTGRSIYQGHLFVNDHLLNESGMQNHPITPMEDSDLRRVMQAQCKAKVGHVAYADVASGAQRLLEKLNEQEQAGHLFIVVDAISDDDLLEIGKAVCDVKLITGGSGVALGLPANFVASGDISRSENNWQGQSGPIAALSGSCSIATRNQIEVHSQQHPTYQLNADDVINGSLSIESVVGWVLAQTGVPLVYSSANPDEVASTQAKHTQAVASDALENFFAQLAQQLVAAGVTKLISAGGETSGAVVEALSLSSLALGPEIDPGVPALRASDDLVIALKSGNFGAPDFFEKAALLMNNQ